MAVSGKLEIKFKRNFRVLHANFVHFSSAPTPLHQWKVQWVGWFLLLLRAENETIGTIHLVYVDN